MGDRIICHSEQCEESPQIHAMRDDIQPTVDDMHTSCDDIHALVRD